MKWVCPECRKEFRNKNQWHSCAKTDLDDHLKNKSPTVVSTVKELLTQLGCVCEFSLNPVKTSIQVKAGATFLSIKPKRDHVEVEFQLGREVDQIPVYRRVRVSKNRVVHFAVLEGPEEVDSQLIDWLKESHGLVAG